MHKRDCSFQFNAVFCSTMSYFVPETHSPSNCEVVQNNLDPDFDIFGPPISWGGGGESQSFNQFYKFGSPSNMSKFGGDRLSDLGDKAAKKRQKERNERQQQTRTACVRHCRRAAAIKEQYKGSKQTLPAAGGGAQGHWNTALAVKRVYCCRFNLLICGRLVYIRVGDVSLFSEAKIPLRRLSRNFPVTSVTGMFRGFIPAKIPLTSRQQALLRTRVYKKRENRRRPRQDTGKSATSRINQRGRHGFVADVVRKSA